MGGASVSVHFPCSVHSSVSLFAYRTFPLLSSSLLASHRRFLCFISSSCRKTKLFVCVCSFSAQLPSGTFVFLSWCCLYSNPMPALEGIASSPGGQLGDGAPLRGMSYDVRCGLLGASPSLMAMNLLLRRLPGKKSRRILSARDQRV